MKRIEQYLQKLANNVVQSKTTISQYYSIGIFIIRYSDHVVFPAKVDLQIIFPTASFCDYYAVFYRETTKPMILNAKQIANMLGVLTTINQLESVTKSPTIPVTDTLIFPTKLVTVSDDGFHIYSTPWNNKSMQRLQGIVTKLYNTSKGFTIFRLFLVSNPCTYAEVVTIYYTVRVLNNIEIPSESLYKTVLTHIRTLNK